MVDDEQRNGGLAKSVESGKTALQATENAAKYAWNGVQSWVQRRRFSVQLLLAGVLAVLTDVSIELITGLLTTIGDELGGFLSTVQLPTVTNKQLLVALIGILLGHIWNLTRKLNKIEGKVDGMDPSSAAVTDGGHRDNERDEEVETSGGGALGGLIAGAAIGSSFGPGGTVGGAFIGAILGDELEQRSERTVERERQHRTRS